LTPPEIPVPLSNPRDLVAAIFEIGAKAPAVKRSTRGAARGIDVPTKPFLGITLSRPLSPIRDARALGGKGEIQWRV
jgi:hypothetical protein